MAATFFLSQQQVLDSNADPLAGALLYTYSESTTTPLAAYTDEALTTAHTNPIVADGDGRFGAIYLQAAAYKFVLKTAAGAPVWTLDNFNPDGGTVALAAVSDSIFSIVDNSDGTKAVKFEVSGVTTATTRTLTVPDRSGVIGQDIASVATISALKALSGGQFPTVHVQGHTSAGDGGGGTFYWASADTTTDDNGVYIQPNAGGTGRWIRVMTGSVIDLAWYGLPTGSDDTSVLTTASTLAASLNKEVFAPGGTYIINGFTAANGVVYRGVPGETIWKRPNSAAGNASIATVNYPARFVGIIFDGNATNNTNAGNNVTVTGRQAGDIHFEDCISRAALQVSGGYGAGYVIDDAARNRSGTGTGDGSTVTFTVTNGAGATEEETRVFKDDEIVSRADYSVADNGNDLDITFSVAPAAAAALEFYVLPNSGVTFVNCEATDNDAAGLLAEEVTNLDIDGFIAEQNGGAGVSVGGLTFPGADRFSEGSTIKNVRARLNAGSGVELLGFIEGGTVGAPVFGPDNPDNYCIRASNIFAEYNTKYGVALQGEALLVQDVISRDNSEGTTSAYGQMLANVSRSVVKGFYLTGVSGTFGLDAGGAHYSKITDGIIDRCATEKNGGGYGLNIGAARYTDVAGIKIIECGPDSAGSVGIYLPGVDGDGSTDGGYDWESTGNTIRDCEVHLGASSSRIGIKLTKGANDTLVRGNLFFGGAANALIVDETDSAVVEGNRWMDNLAGPTVSAATTTVIPDGLEQVILSGTASITGLETYSRNANSGKITHIRVTAAGSGYTSQPTVSITGGGGSGAAATAYMTGDGRLAYIEVTNRGSGYTSVPTVSFSGGGGSGATATAVVGVDNIYERWVSLRVAVGSSLSIAHDGVDLYLRDQLGFTWGTTDDTIELVGRGGTAWFERMRSSYDTARRTSLGLKFGTDFSSARPTNEGDVLINHSRTSFDSSGGWETQLSDFANGYGSLWRGYDGGGGDIRHSLGFRVNAAAWTEMFRYHSSGKLDILSASGQIHVNGSKVLAARGAAVSDTSITYTINNPSITPDNAVTIADGSAPTASELLHLCVELKNQIETLKSRLDATSGHGLIS